MHGMVLLHIMRSTLAVALGLSMVIGGSILALQWSSMLNNFINKQLAIVDGSLNFEHWRATPVPMYIDIYFHNWTNWRDIKTQKPHFQQVGPYRFYEKRTKVDLVWNDNDTVSYKQTRHWYFDPQNSNGSLLDNVTTVNPVSVTGAYSVRFKDYFEKKTMSLTLLGLRQNIAITKTVEQLLFGGYKDDLIDLARILNRAKVADKFGWFYQRNGSTQHDGIFNMATGRDNLENVGKILSWNYANKTKYFEGDCGKVRGFSGEVFPPGLTSASKLSLYSPDLCRPIHLRYQDEDKVYGIPGLRFTGGKEIFDSGALNPENKCYCNGECSSPWGLLNVTSCRQGAPMFVSYPHFYNSDPALLQQVDGMQPDQDKHSFQLTIQPDYGFPMDLKARFQLNLMIEPLDDISLVNDVPKRIFMPIIWFDQRAGLTCELSVQVWLLLVVPYLGYGLAAVLILLGLVTAYVHYLKMSSHDKIAGQRKHVNF